MLLEHFSLEMLTKNQKPPTLFTSGTKTFKVTSTVDGSIPLPSDLPLASSATGTFLGTGTVQTQTNQLYNLEIHLNHQQEKMSK